MESGENLFNTCLARSSADPIYPVPNFEFFLKTCPCGGGGLFGSKSQVTTPESRPATCWPGGAWQSYCLMYLNDASHHVQ